MLIFSFLGAEHSLQRKGRARADGEFIVFVKDKSREQVHFKASLIKGENAEKALEKAAMNTAKSAIKVSNIPTSQGLVNDICYTMQNLLSPASNISNDSQGLVDNSLEFNPSTPLDVAQTASEEREECSHEKQLEGSTLDSRT